MPATRGVKRTASKTPASPAPSAPKNKKKRGIQLEIPSAPKIKGCVLACGQGDVGQLGLGEDVMEATKFKFVSALGKNIVDVCAGGMHTIALDSDGKVWSYGCNDEGALGRATGDDAEEGAPGPVALPARAVRVAAGDSHSAALLLGGDVYAWGAFRDSHGSMGLVMRGREGKPSREPLRVDVGEPAADIASGGDHLVILTTSGAVYTMGCGEQGQLGRLSQRSASRDARQGFSALLVPARVTLRGGARRVWAGYHATFALDAAGERVFAWGLNNYGQLGITGEKRKGAIYSPMECDAFAPGGGGGGEGSEGGEGGEGGGWRAVACGQHHSLALDGAGRVYSIGRCEYGRLGLGERTGDAEVLEPVPKLQNKKCISIAAGTSNSFAVTDSGEVFAWGMGSEGQLGTGECADAAAPTAPALPAALRHARPAAVSAGGQHTVLLVEDKTESSPEPKEAEKETEDEKMDTVEESKEEKAKEKKEPKSRKRQRKQEQEDDVSSTSSAQPGEVAEESAPKAKKLNGDKKKATPMEVDETDKPEEKNDHTEPASTKTDGPQQDPSEDTEPEDASKPEPVADNKPETTDTSSQGTTDSDTKSQESADAVAPAKASDVEMQEEAAAKPVNGTDEAPPATVEAKPVEAPAPAPAAIEPSALATTA